MKLLPKPIVGLKALLDGKDLELDGKKYFFDNDGINLVGEDLKTKEEILLPVDMTLAEFIKLCNKEPDTIYLQNVKIN